MLAFITALALAQAEAPTNPIPASVLAHVPAEAVVCVQVASQHDLRRALRGLWGDPETAAFDFEGWLEESPFYADPAPMFDPARSMLTFTTSLDFRRTPILYAIIATHNPEAAVARFDGSDLLSVVDLGEGYIGLTEDPRGFPTSATPSELPLGLGTGLVDVALRVDDELAGYIELAKFAIRSTLAETVAEIEQDAEAHPATTNASLAFLDASGGAALGILDGFEGARFSIGTSGGRAQAELELQWKPDSPLAQRLATAELDFADLVLELDRHAGLGLATNLDLAGALDAGREPLFDLLDALVEQLGDEMPAPDGWPNAAAAALDVSEAMLIAYDALAVLGGGVVAQLGDAPGEITLAATAFDETAWRHAFEDWLANPMAHSFGFVAKGELQLGFDRARFEEHWSEDQTALKMASALEAYLASPLDLGVKRRGALRGVFAGAPSGEVDGTVTALAERVAPGSAALLGHINMDALARLFSSRPFADLAGRGEQLAASLTHDGTRTRLAVALDNAALADLLRAEKERTTPDFARDVLPLFERACTNCHGERRQKEGLRLDSLAGVRAGSEWGAVIEPGMADASVLVQALRAPLDDDLHMPPPNKTQLTRAEIERIAAWVDSLN